MFEKLDALFGALMLTLELVSPKMDILKEFNNIFFINKNFHIFNYNFSFSCWSLETWTQMRGNIFWPSLHVP
jgi:hypothetical protein